MVDSLTPEARSALMSRIRGKNTKPEMFVRRLVHGMGYRFRLHRKDLPGKPDLVFPRLKKVIFMHGCFWHYHDDPECKSARIPKSNQAFWKPKLEGNRARDKSNEAKLRELGWEVMVIWECQTRKRDADRLRQEVSIFLDSTGGDLE